MTVAEAIGGRRSIRSYLPREVEAEKLEAVLEAGRLAPSARNRQEWRFVAVTDPTLRERLAQAAHGQEFVAQAPVVLVICDTGGEYTMTCGQPGGTVDCSIALSFMMLQATELGLGTCWLGKYDEQSVREILDIPNAARVVAMTPLGYPAEDPAPRPRKQTAEVVTFNGYR